MSPSVFFVTLRRSRRVSSFKQRWRFFADAQNDKINAQKDRVGMQNDRMDAQKDRINTKNDGADDQKDRVDAWKDRGGDSSLTLRMTEWECRNDSTYYLSVTLNEVKGLFL